MQNRSRAINTQFAGMEDREAARGYGTGMGMDM